MRSTTPNGGVKRSTRNEHRDSKCPSARCFRMVRGDTGAPSEGATCTWKAAKEAVGCTWTFLTMRRIKLSNCRSLPNNQRDDNPTINLNLLRTPSAHLLA
ncbi:hypothetical protein TNCV_1550921 [Trichonephila clavipes]|nr:hypothetical protein TNCV_1550921 [Trichonephila clavipes]